MINKTEADMRNEFKEQAERSVKSRLVLDAIAKAEKLENSEEERAEKIVTSDEVLDMSDDDLLDMDYFLHEFDELDDDDFGEEGFYIF